MSDSAETVAPEGYFMSRLAEEHHNRIITLERAVERLKAALRAEGIPAFTVDWMAHNDGCQEGHTDG